MGKDPQVYTGKRVKLPELSELHNHSTWMVHWPLHQVLKTQKQQVPQPTVKKGVKGLDAGGRGQRLAGKGA